MERASGTVTFSGQSVGFVDQIAPFVVVVKGTGATNGDVQISLNGTANGPYDQRAPASVPISGNYSGNHNNFNCVATNFSANNLNNEFNGSITLFPQTSISTPDYSASCTNLGSTFTATSCSTLQWSISTNSAGPYQPIPGQTGASLTLTRAMVTGMGFSNLITTFYVKATGRDQTTSDFRQATLYYPPPQFSANAISPTCSNGTGSVQVTITPSTPVITDFVVSLFTDPVGPGTDATTSLTLHQFNGLGGGQYYVMVRNNTNTAVYGNCSTDRQLVGTVTIPPPVNVSLTPTNATCYGYANGSIQATIQNAVGSVGFSWTGAGSGANIRTNLSAGNYSLTVTDSRGCTGNNNATVGQPTPVVADATSPAPYGGFNVRCAGESNGSLNASASGGSGGFTYYWSTGHTGPNVPNVGTGLYSVTAVDANGCQANDNVQLSAPPPIDFSIGIDNAVTCPGTSTGSLSPQNIANAVGLLAYSWSTGETTSAINSKPAGQYSLTITDGGGSGCSATRQQTLVDPQPFTVQISPQSNFHGSYISCDGGADGALNAAVTDLSGSAVAAQNYQWYRNNIFYAGGPGLNTLNLLDAATYRVEATYGSGCITQASYVLNDPQPVSAQISATSNHHGFAISCPGASDGTLLATGSDGTPGGYTFQWYNGPATASISGVPAGTYFVNVTDINGCEGSANYVLNDPLPMLPTIDITSNYHGQAISCANASDAILTASAMNGAAPVQFSWSNGLQGNVVNNISAGSYTVTAEDANGCEVVSQPLVVTNPNPVSASIAIVSDYNGQAIQCHNGNNGILTVSGSGGTNNYSYLWNTGATTMQANGLSSGTYSVIVRDQNNCEDSDEEELINPSQVVASIKSHSNYNGFGVSCHGSENGAIEVEAVGGTDDFTFSWPALAQTTAAVENLTPGTYQVIVTDLNGCTDELSYEVTEPDLLSTQLSMATDISCFAGSDGVIVAAAAGGFGQTQFSINGVDWQESPAFGSLVADQLYTISVLDENECLASFTHSLTQPDEITIDFTVAPALCAEPIGQITALASGGVGELMHQWHDGVGNPIGNSAVISEKPAGIYQVTITDQNNCQVTEPVGIPSLDGPELEVVETGKTSCYGSADGTALVGVTTGNGPFSIVWDDGPQTWTRGDLDEGVHYASVTDANSCVTVIPIPIESPRPVLLQVVEKNDPSCFKACDGEISVSAQGGNGDFQFLWNTQPVASTVNGLCAGVHYFSVVDKLGCTGALTTNLNSPEPLRIKSVNRKLPNCADGCDGAITLTPSGGNGDYAYQWSQGSITRTQENICPGSYEVTVRDGRGCTLSGTLALGNPTKVEASIVRLETPVCFGDCNGILEISARGGAGNYKYFWQDGSSESINKSLCAGQHMLTVADDHNCQITETYNIPNVPALNVEIGDGIVLCEGQQHELDAGLSWTEVQWWQEDALISTADKIIITEPARYRVEVWDAKRCKASDTFILETSDDLLQASFLMPGEALAGDTVAIIEISWPLPENISWKFPQEMVKLQDLGDVVFGKFDDAGNYNITLNATLGSCRDQLSKTITITDDHSTPIGGRLGAREFVKSLTLHPNPNTGAFEVEVEFDELSAVEMRIWSIATSKLVAEVTDSGSSIYRKSFNLTSLGSGAYVLKVAYNGGYRTLRFLVH